jgi:hypothetical protein
VAIWKWRGWSGDAILREAKLSMIATALGKTAEGEQLQAAVEAKLAEAKAAHPR